jgi:hypothetical protein
MRSRKVATARHCRTGPTRASPVIRDGWPAGARKPVLDMGIRIRDWVPLSGHVLKRADRSAAFYWASYIPRAQPIWADLRAISLAPRNF